MAKETKAQRAVRAIKCAGRRRGKVTVEGTARKATVVMSFHPLTPRRLIADAINVIPNALAVSEVDFKAIVRRPHAVAVHL